MWISNPNQPGTAETGRASRQGQPAGPIRESQDERARNQADAENAPHREEGKTIGLRIERRFTNEGTSPYDTIEWSVRDSRISNPDGSVVFEMKDAEIPATWSQVAADIMVSKYFRKAGVPQFDAEGNQLFDESGEPVLGPERSAKQVISRLASTWRWWGENNGYFADEESAQAFEDELAYMLIHQMAAPNSPQWFNTGLHHAYGITGPPQGFWYVDPESEDVTPSPDSYTRPAPHACFPEGTRITTSEGLKPIEKIEPDDLVLTRLGRYRAVTETMQRQVDEQIVDLTIGAITRLELSTSSVVVTEIASDVLHANLRATQNHPILAFRNVAVSPTADKQDLVPEWIDAGKLERDDYVVIAADPGYRRRIGDYAVVRVLTPTSVPFSGTVYNFQVEEDESYVANGVMVHNCFINSVDDDLVNPGGIMDLWVREARLFKFGSGTGTNFSSLRAEGESLSGGGKSSGLMSFLKVGDRAAGAIKSGGTTRRAAKMVILDVDHPDIETFINWKAGEEKKVRALVAAGYPADFNGEAYATVSGQNSNNSVRLSNEFIDAVLADGYWDLTARTDGTVMKTVKARDLWHQIAQAAWECADPGVQFDTTIQEWHTSPGGGRIRATNPCFTGDTRIATDKGLISFKDLVTRVNDGETFDVYSHDATNERLPEESLRLSRPTQLMVTGTNKILELRFSDGRQIRCTPNHRFFTHNRGWVRSDELLSDDRVRLLDADVDFGMASWAIPVSSDTTTYQRRSSRTYEVRLPEKWTTDFAHYLGWLVGDGSITSKEAATIYGTEHEQQTTMLIHQELLAEINGGFSPKPVRMANGTYQLRVTRHATRKFLEALGMSHAKAPDKRIPWSIFEAPKTIVAAFLRGLFDADGTVVYSGDKNRYAGVASASAALLRDVQQLLDTFGIHGKIYTTGNAKRGNFEYVTQQGELRVYASGPMFDLRITGTSLTTFAKSIGFQLSFKQDRLDQMLMETGRYRTRDWVSLKSVTDAGFETTYNLTEPVNHSYIAGGMLVSNCSEYVFLDNTACNLASLNLAKFLDDDTGQVDLEAYRHAIRLWTIVLEISVTMAHFPSEEIARGSYDYRTLGLGYANLGSLLMRVGIPYDSDEGRAIAGALTAMLTGYAYATSAEMAAVVGPFARFAENRDSMLRVMRNHRKAAHNAPSEEYEDVSHRVLGIDEEFCPPYMLAEARKAWDEAVQLGEQNGYRNAQATVLAPTGTIGLLMDCDTTGVEPDFALVKFKKLSGGGYFKIANQSIASALKSLGYSDLQTRQILDYVVGTMSLTRSPHINTASLMAKGFTSEELDKIDATLPGVFELGFAFNRWTLGVEVMERIGFTPEEYDHPSFDMLAALGFTPDQIGEANDHICGRQTIEGAPGLDPQHLPVFDCANKNGRIGERFIHHTGHIKMMGSAQPFISGAISKTINMPNDVSVEAIEESYRLSWELGLKAMALYRDGSKASQPLSASSDDGVSEDEEEGLEEALHDEIEIVSGHAFNPAAIPVGYSPAQAYASMPRPRFLLPARRAGYTQEARIGGHKVFLRTGEYADGTLGEVFIDLAKEGATLRGILSCFAIAVSKGIQYGVPLEEFVDTFTYQTFEPRGIVEGDPNIKMASSIVDYVFRALGVEYLHRDELAQVPPDRSELPGPPKGLAVEAGIQLPLEQAVLDQDIVDQARAARFVDSPSASDQPAYRNAAVTTRVDEGSASLAPAEPSSNRSGGGTAVAQVTGGAPKVATMASNGNGAAAVSAADIQTSSIQAVLADKMGDAPLCDTCGHITIRNGSCYRCLNCGDSKGCS